MTVQVVLENAYRWVCPRCDETNWEAAEQAELTPDEQAEYAERLGCDDVEMVSAPTEVECSKCENIFQVLQEEQP